MLYDYIFHKIFTKGKIGVVLNESLLHLNYIRLYFKNNLLSISWVHKHLIKNGHLLGLIKNLNNIGLNIWGTPYIAHNQNNIL